MGGMLGQHVRWAGTGPRNGFRRSGLRGQVEGLLCSRMSEALAQGGQGRHLVGDHQGSMCGDWAGEIQRPISRARNTLTRSDIGWQGELEVLSRMRGQWPSEAWGWWQGRAGKGGIGGICIGEGVRGLQVSGRKPSGGGTSAMGRGRGGDLSK